MTKTLQSALAPLFIISSFLCLGLFEYPLGQPRPYFSCLYTLAVWGTLIYYIYYPICIYMWQLKLIVIANITVPLELFVTLSLIFNSFYRCKELKICLHELSIVDDTLEALGAPKKYRMIRKWIIQIIIGWITLSFIDLAGLFYSFFSKYSFRSENLCLIIFKILAFNYRRHFYTSNALICGTVIGYTSSRFHQVNNQLHEFYYNLFENNTDCRYRRQNRSILVRQRITEVEDRKEYIWIIM
ncbi:hypothetical protein ALC62_11520 [Cyphomyrmex costatus]|uniref:Gustatory receptor n=1 Tax=Cyphomyrmex costatus TaxID=456900 RepID=A0A151ICJ8_9HYME|nr:hypothetical protein ALC62_11520 [Cyphomyrmex costatus]